MARPTLVDRDLERIVAVSACYLFDQTSRTVVDILSTADFEDIESRRVWAAVEALVAERDGWIGGWETVAKRAGWTAAEWHRYADGVQWVVSHEVPRQAEALADMAAYRRLQLIGRGMVNQVEQRTPVDDIVTATLDHLEGVRSVVPERPLPRTLADIMADTDVKAEYDWLVPGWLERKDRVMLTGGEGFGKMTLMRQWAVQMAAGFHPWTGADVEPLVCLQVDLQDGQARNEREFRWIARNAGVDPFDHLYAESWEAGLNILRSQRDRRAVESIIRSTRPHVVFLGPVYRLALKSDRKEGETAQGICDFVDTMRHRYDVAFVLEAHSPKVSQGRVTYDPYGGQEYKAWPDAGYGLAPEGKTGAELRPFRQNRDRRDKAWPEKLSLGEVWPWVPKAAPASVLALRPRTTMATMRTIPNDDGFLDDALGQAPLIPDPDAYN